MVTFFDVVVFYIKKVIVVFFTLEYKCRLHDGVVDDTINYDMFISRS